jgi:hypothetical protein
VLADDVLAQSTESLQNGEFLEFGPGQAPTVALDGSCNPHVLTVLAWSKTTYSSRDAAGAWSSESTSLPSYSGALALGANGQPLAVVSDGNFNTTLWARGEGWSQVNQLPGLVGIDGQGLAIDGTGALHAALSGEQNDSVATFAGSWTVQGGPAVFDALPPVIAVSATSTAQVASWTRPTSNPPQGMELRWWTSPSAPEVVATGGSGGSMGVSEIIGIVTTAADVANPDGKPHLVFEVAQGSGDSQLVYATRTGPSQWTTTTIVQDTTLANPCNSTIASAGMTCSYDYTNHQPVGITASQSGDVRVFFAARHFAGTLTVQCESGPNPACSWSPQSPAAETDTISVAWVSGGSVQTVPLTTTNQPSAATVAVDATGVMHLALYEAVTNGDTTNGYTTVFSTRYLRIGSTGQ